jgi:hypothetical protein
MIFAKSLSDTIGLVRPWQAKSGDGVWRTTDDGAKVFIESSGELRGGGPAGPVVGGTDKKQTRKIGKNTAKDGAGFLRDLSDAELSTLNREGYAETSKHGLVFDMDGHALDESMRRLDEKPDDHSESEQQDETKPESHEEIARREAKQQADKKIDDDIDATLAMLRGIKKPRASKQKKSLQALGLSRSIQLAEIGGRVLAIQKLIRQMKSCGANADGGGGFQPGNTCAAGDGGTATKGAPKRYAAKDMPADMSGEVEIFDPDSGQVFTTATADEARAMFAEELAESGTLDGLAVREVTQESKAEAEQKEKEFWAERDRKEKEARRQEQLATSHGLREGHNDFVPPPETLYHATFNADDIIAQGFKSGDEVGKQVLGGSASHLVSFTTKENAETYRNGLEHARLAATGQLSDSEMIQVATQYNVSEDRAKKLMQDVSSQRHNNPSLEFFQRVSMEGKTFPLFMGGTWPEHIKNAGPAEIVAVQSSRAGDVYYNPGETEWRVGDYQNLKPKKVG